MRDLKPRAPIELFARAGVLAALAAALCLPGTYNHGLAAEAAGPLWMTDPEIRTRFAGVTVEGRYGNGGPFTESYKEDGRLTYSDARHNSEGKWSIQAGTFCTIYDSDPSGGCYRVKKVGGNCYEFYFVARTEHKARTDQLRPAWTARGSIAGEPGKCADEQSV